MADEEGVTSPKWLLREAIRYANEESDDKQTKVGAVLLTEDGNLVYSAN